MTDYVKDSMAAVSSAQYRTMGKNEWEMVERSALKDAGDVSYTKLDWIPVEYQGLDFFGRPRNAGVSVDIGAIEDQKVQ